MRSALALVFVVACGGAEFQPIIGDDVDANAGDAIAAADVAAGDVIAPDAGDDVGEQLDAFPPWDASADAPLCCVWLDAGAHATSCGPGDWACVTDARPDVSTLETCYPSTACAGDRTGGPCVLNDDSHGFVYGTIERCP